jgi:hypothetical protein
MKFGTCHFTTKAAAIRYYSNYNGYNRGNRIEVERKIAEGEIYIGPPTLKPGETLSVIPGEDRYAIEGFPDPPVGTLAKVTDYVSQPVKRKGCEAIL